MLLESNFEDLYLTPSVELYDNIATSGDCRGRLKAELEIHPSPRIVWEFESLGEGACYPAVHDMREVDNPFEGRGFTIEKP